jgi:hypothetical protein
MTVLIDITFHTDKAIAERASRVRPSWIHPVAASERPVATHRPIGFPLNISVARLNVRSSTAQFRMELVGATCL